MAGKVKLTDIIKNAVIATAARPPHRRGPFIFDEAELQSLASALSQQTGSGETGE